MKLVNMKLAAEKTKEYVEPTLVGGDTNVPAYPYGLCLRLENDQLDKLGLDIKNLVVSQGIKLLAQGEIKGVYTNEQQGQKAQQSVEIQITELVVKLENAKAGKQTGGEESKEQSAETILYEGAA